MKVFTHQFNFKKARCLKMLIGIGIFCSFFTSVYAIGVCSISRFNSSSLIPVGVNPRQVFTGDVNGDSLLDLVVLSVNFNSSTSVATTFVSNATGNFSAFTSVPLNFSASSAALADFNQDGVADLVASGTSSFSSNPSAVAVFINNGTGVFSQQSNLTVQGSTIATETGDFNRDGAIDIAVASSNNNGFGNINLFLNDGFGNFSLAGTFSIGGFPREIKIADFNNDGIADVISINTNATASLLLGSSSGSFQVATNIVLFNNSSSFSSPVSAVGDLNNDNLPDLVLTNQDSTSFYVFLNNGGNFSAPTQINFTDFNLRVRSIAVGQVVGDNNLDIVIGVGGSFSDSVSEAAIFQGNGTGTFNPANPITAPTGTTPISVMIADFNNDGRNDIVTANNTSADVSVLLNNNDRFGPNTFAATPGSNVIAAADFNGDGNLDTVTASSNTSSGGTTNLLVSLGNGSGGVSSTQNVGFTNAVTAIIVGDLNNDSRVDLVTASAATNSGISNTVTVYLNTGISGQVFQSIPSSSVNVGFTIKNLILGDFNNDGRKDIVAGSTNSNSIALLPSAANGVYSSFTSFATPVSSPSVAAGNFNNDNNLDLAIAGTNSTSGIGAIYTFLGNGSGGFSQVSDSLTVTNPTSIASGDFNGDSITDIAVTTSNGSFSNAAATVAVALGIGGGRFSQPVSYSVGIDARAVTAVDFNGDSRLDLVVANRGSNSVSVLLNLGNGKIFSSANNFLAGIFPESLAVGDFNNDGRNEVATVNRGGNNFSILVNSCLEAVTKTDYTGEGKSDFAVFRPSTATWLILSSDLNNTRIQQFGANGDIPVPGDYDGDGISDLAVFRPSNGVWYILRSSTNRSFTVSFGINGDIPVANDYDGDGRTDIGVFRPSNGTWYVRRVLSSQGQFSIQFGTANDRPVPADYDGDGRADIAVYRSGLWIVLRSSNSSVSYQQFGVSSDIPTVGDYDGDGKSDLAVFRAGVWYVLQSASNSVRIENFGISTDVPQQADYDGDGKTDLAVFRAGIWYVLPSRDRQVRSVQFGTSTDIPTTSLYRY